MPRLERVIHLKKNNAKRKQLLPSVELILADAHILEEAIGQGVATVIEKLGTPRVVLLVSQRTYFLDPAAVRRSPGSKVA